jgi:hypothetical protein
LADRTARSALPIAQVTRIGRDIAEQLVTDPRYRVAVLHALLVEKDDAFAILDALVAERSQLILPLGSYPIWDPLRDDYRFPALLRRMGLEGWHPLASG